MLRESVLTPSEARLLELLTWKVRLVSEMQLRRLSGFQTHRLLAMNYLATRTACIRLWQVDSALAAWTPGMRLPNFSTIAWRLEQRRQQTAAVTQRVFWAAPRAVRLMGGSGGRVRQPTQVEHDLAVTAVLLRRSEMDPSTWDCWLGEDILRQRLARKQKIPDAVLVDAFERITLAVEYGGAYSVKRLQAFHNHCKRTKVPYEIW